MSHLEAHHLQILHEQQRLLGDLSRAVARRARPARRQALPDMRAPCFAQMTVQLQTGHTRDLLLGAVTLVDPELGVDLLDFRTSPLGAVFFAFEEGEAYEEELEGRTFSGRVLRKRLLTFEEGELCVVTTPTVHLRRARDGVWRVEPVGELPRLDPGKGGSLARKLVQRDGTGRRIPVVTGLLDQEQRAALERDDRRPLLLLGGAGCGKTTVALHRMAWLHHRMPARYRQKNMAVVVPEIGLERLTRYLLDELGLDEAGVWTFDRWIAHQARRLFRDLPRRICAMPPGRVVSLKRHPALLEVLPRAVERRVGELWRELDQALSARGEVAARLARDPGHTPLERLGRVESWMEHGRSGLADRDLRAAFSRARGRLYEAREDLLYLFGDKELMEEVVALSRGELTASAAGDVVCHTRAQFARTSKERYADVLAEQMHTADDRGLDDGTPSEVAGTVDAEDFAVAMELLRQKTGRMRTPHGRVAYHAHLVIDEAQDLAPVELRALGHGLRHDSSLTVCGDQAQHIDPGAWFASWEGALGNLGVKHTATLRLTTGYRCPAPVTRLAHQVLGPLAPAEQPRATHDGAPVARSLHATEAHAMVEVVQALGDLGYREPAATVAIICRTMATARRWHAVVDRALPCRLVLDGRFTFTPGVDITTVAQVKGLEWDVVVLPDLGPTSYPDAPSERRRLHVAATRAIETLWILAVGRFSPLLPPA